MTSLTLDHATEAFLKQLQHFSKEDSTAISRALDFTRHAHEGQMRSDGTPFLLHPIAVAEILLAWGADRDTVIAGLLHDALEDTSASPDHIRTTFGPNVLTMIEGVTKFEEADFAGDASLDRKIETLRKLFEVMRSDIRVAVIKLADRLHNVLTISALPEDRQKRFAQETLEIYYKIAYHLGMNDIRRSFSEHCFPLLYPEEAAEFEKRRGRELAHVQRILPGLESALRSSDTGDSLVLLRAEPRSLVSLHEHKFRRREDEPAFAVIAVARDRDACYALLKVLHTLYRPIPGTFRDYIAVPTESAYQSIRTAVLGPGNTLLPVRIRTAKMDAQEKQGILLQCFGKVRDIPGFSWLERSEHHDVTTRDSSEAFWEALQSDIFQETITVTVDGETFTIARGSTALDAVYARYGDEGSHMGLVMVNGAQADAGAPLSGDDIVSVRLDALPSVELPWLEKVTTRYARSLIVSSLKERSINEKLLIGQRLLQKELDHFRKGLLGELTKTQKKRAADHFRRPQFDDVIAMVGEGVLQARDVVFALYPEKRPSDFLRIDRDTFSHGFRVRITGGGDPGIDILPQVSALARIYSTKIGRTRLRHYPKWGTFDLTLQGVARDRLHFADFLAAIERLRDVSSVATLLSTAQLLLLGGSIFLAFEAIVLDILFLPSFAALKNTPLFITNMLPLLPILGVNYLLLRLLRHYIVRLRTDRWYIGLGFLMNAIGLTLLIFRSNAIGETVSLLPFTAVFLLSMFALGYQFFRSEALFTQVDRRTLRPPTTEQWRARRRQKALGYLIRLCAVIFWGIQPLYLKYTPASTVEPFPRLYLMYVGAIVTTLLLVPSWKMFSRRRSITLRIPWTNYMLGIVVGEALFLYFQSASLLSTTSTNFALLSNFSPVVALLVAALLWRHSIPYLRDPKHMLWIFLIFLIGSTGGSLIIYQNARFTQGQTLMGDSLALVAMVADVLVITSQIRYVKLIPRASSFALNTHMFGWVTLALTPTILYLYATSSSSIATLTTVPALYGLGAGVLLAVGMFCNFEAFRRIDGFIAFLMFNVSILINFITEAFFLETIVPTWPLVLGGTIIMGSTILAEMVNSHCEKQGL